MFEELNLPIIMMASLIALASPGPATLAIAGTSMSSGRKYGLALASGITTGSLMWSISAALGLTAIMYTNAWVFEIIRYAGAGYLLYLAIKSARSSLSNKPIKTSGMYIGSAKKAYIKGVGIHLTNPKAVLFFGTLYANAIPKDSSPEILLIVVLAVGLQSLIMFHFYALIFSSKPVVAGYAKLRRWFEAVFACIFGFAGFAIFTASLTK